MVFHGKGQGVCIITRTTVPLRHGHTLPVSQVVEGNVKHTVDPACLTPRLKAEGYVAVCVANVVRQ